MSVRDAISGFYAVLDRDDEALAHALVREARVLQVRIKPHGGAVDDTALRFRSAASPGGAGLVDASDVLRIAQMARRICDDAGAALIVNDRVDIALAVEADGVHLGQTDLPIEEARRLAPDLWIGVSTHNLDQVRAACDAGADYLGFGPVFATATKLRPDPVQGVDGLRAAVAQAAGHPVVAIGGITADRVGDVYRTGVHAVCAISAVNNARDPRDAARRFCRPKSA